MKKTLSIILALCLPLIAAGQTGIRQIIKDIDQCEAFRGGNWGLFAVNLAGDTLACHNAWQRMVPASNVKVFATGTAMHRLGPDFRFRTTLAYSGAITDGILDGDLYIIGGGDPTTAAGSNWPAAGEALFAEWLKILKDNGITSIKGTIVGDGRAYESGRDCYDWSEEDLGFYYGAVPGALNFYENAQDFRVAAADSAGKPVTVETEYPAAPWMIFNHACKTSPAGNGDQLYYFATDFAPFGQMRGFFAMDRQPKTESCINFFPEYTCAYYFHNYLTANGIQVDNAFAEVSPYGRIRRDMLLYDEGEDAAAQDSLTVLGSTKSPSLAEISSRALHKSDNFYTEAIFKALGRELTGSTAQDSCIKAEKQVLAGLGVKNIKGVQLRDGCGLSRKNYVSPAFFVRFLCAMTGSPAYGRYLKCFPHPGEDTLQAVMRNSEDSTKKRVFIKSGSMDGVRCYCGYILPADGKTENTVVFSVMTNNMTAKSQSIIPQIDKLLTELSR